MAKHMVKCLYCEHYFDANQEPFVKLQNGRRYAHQACHDQAVKLQEQEQVDKQALKSYIKTLFNYDTIPKRVENQIKEYITKNKYSYSGILKTLKYFFEVKGNTIEKANGGIGIVPFVYDKARDYWYDIWVTQQTNKEQVKYVKSQVREIRIRPPQREPMKHIRKLFTFLEEDNL